MPTRSRLRRGGFTFTEVLFAVLILGIGFIMIAGIFPVSLQQTRLNQEETAGAQIAMAAVTSKSGKPDSIIVGTSGSRTERSREVMASGRSLPVGTCCTMGAMVEIRMLACPPRTAITEGAPP